MAATLSLGDIFCLPSYREGLPKVLLEAMSSGLPCVSTDVPGCRDVVRHGDTGLLVPAGDSAALASAIADLINNEEQRLEMGRRGRKRVVEGFSEAQTISATMRVYKELIA
jgi:glycosyltransferase involved in cell wall biosynthesis